MVDDWWAGRRYWLWLEHWILFFGPRTLCLVVGETVLLIEPRADVIGVWLDCLDERKFAAVGASMWPVTVIW